MTFGNIQPITGPGRRAAAVVLCLCLSFLLVACSGAAGTPGVVATSTPGATSTLPPAESQTPTASPTALPTPTQALTAPAATPTPESPRSDLVPAPPGLFFRTAEGLWRVGASGKPELLTARTLALPSPDGRSAILRDDNGVVWLLDLASGQEQALDLGVQAMGLFSWLDSQRCLIGFWAGVEDEGPNTGRLGLYDLSSGVLTDLETGLTSAPPAVSPDGRLVAYSAFDAAYLYAVGGAAEPLDIAGLAGFPESKSLYYGTAAWSPDGRRLAWLIGGGFGTEGAWQIGLYVLDLSAGAAEQIYAYEPAGFGGWLSAPIWSPDGEWLALPLFASTPEASGLWLVSADGRVTRQVLLTTQITGLVWSGRQLLFSDQSVVESGELRVLDLVAGWKQSPVDLPAGAISIRFLAPGELTNLAEQRSPDGQWWVRFGNSDSVAAGEDETDLYPGGEKYRVQLRVGRVDGSQEWTVIDEWRNWGLGYDTPVPLHWSADGASLYITNYPVPDGCAVFVNGSDLWRLGLTDGGLTELMPFASLSLALSPDETRLAFASYGAGGPQQLVVHDLTSGVEQFVDIVYQPNVQLGNLVWSADGTQVLLTVAHDPCLSSWRHSTVLVDLTTSSARTLVAEDARQLVVEEWPAGGPALLWDKDGSAWKLDPVTGEIEPAG